MKVRMSVVQNSGGVSMIGKSARSSMLPHFEMDPLTDALAGARQNRFTKKSGYRVVLTLHPHMKNIAVEVDGEDVVLEDASFPLTLEATDKEEEKRFHGIPLSQFQRLDCCSET